MIISYGNALTDISNNELTFLSNNQGLLQECLIVSQRWSIFLFRFLCLMAYQSLLVIRCQNYPCRWIEVILFKTYLGGLGGSIISKSLTSLGLHLKRRKTWSIYVLRFFYLSGILLGDFYPNSFWRQIPYKGWYAIKPKHPTNQLST